jgi:hypothetical protein
MQDPEQEKAPFFKSWSSWYILVISFLVILVLLFSLFTKRFS